MMDMTKLTVGRKKGLPPCWTMSEAAERFKVPLRQLVVTMHTTNFKPVPTGAGNPNKPVYNSTELRKWWAGLTPEQRAGNPRAAYFQAYNAAKKAAQPNKGESS